MNKAIIDKSSLIIDLASDAACNQMFSDGLINKEEEMWQDEGSGKGKVYTEQAQDIFDEKYDYFLSMIEQNEIKDEK